MRKVSILAALVLAMAGMQSCDSGKLKEAQAQNQVLDDSLHVALENQDSLLSLVNDISAGMAQIRGMEQILASSGNLNSETQSRRDEIRNDMMTIQRELQARRERLADLEDKLQKSNGMNATLRRTIETLKASLSEQSGTIETLRQDLASAHIEIERLEGNVNTLNATIDTISAEKAETDKMLANTTDAMNRVYYVFGTKGELKDHNIIEGGGFLRKTKIMEGDFDQAYFTTGDRRDLKTITLYSKKAKVLTSQPVTSYTISTDEQGQKVLEITNPDEFWRTSNYLVIQTD